VGGRGEGGSKGRVENKREEGEHTRIRGREGGRREGGRLEGGRQPPSNLVCPILILFRNTRSSLVPWTWPMES
jgi:hypothetical protein